jgi:hypothetical protein
VTTAHKQESMHQIDDDEISENGIKLLTDCVHG